MTSKPLFLLSLNLAGAWAQSGSSCLDTKNAGAANKADCCAGSGTGESDVGGVVFEFTCNSYANNYGAHSHPAKNAHACAQLCLKDTTCHASSWEPTSGGIGGNCWLSSAGFTLTPDPYNTWVILVNTKRAGHVVNPQPDPPTTRNCDEEVKKAEESCNFECENRVQDEVATCQKTADSKCESDKILLKQAENTQCAKEKAENNRELQSQLDTCKESLNEALEAVKKPIDSPNETADTGATGIVTRNNKEWSIHPGHMYAQRKHAGLHTIGQITVSGNLDTCIDRCSEIFDCSVAWVNYDTGECKLGRKSEGFLDPVAQFGRFNAAVLV